MPKSNYARKQILKKVAAKFTDSQVEYLATQAEFNTACDTADAPDALVKLGWDLLHKRTQAQVKPFNPVTILLTH